MSFDLVIGWEPYKTDFRGHEIEMQLRPLKTWASILLTPIYQKSAELAKEKIKQDKAEKEGKKIPPKKMTDDDLNFAYELQKIGAKVFPDHVKDITGLTINKLDITIKDICEETAFGPLAMDIIGELSIRSQLKEPEVKNSNGPSPMPTSVGNIQAH